MNIFLETDFRDYYDHVFDLVGDHVITRNQKDTVTRTKWFNMMGSFGVNVIPYGEPKDIKEFLLDGVEDKATIRRILDTQKLVVYTDEYAHKGEGKELLTLRQASNKYPEHLASRYIDTATTTRYLKIGCRHFYLNYTSLDDWRSNCGTVICEFVSEEEELTPEDIYVNPIQRTVMYAIDFVEFNGKMFAIDFNSAPSWRGTEVEKILSPRDVRDTIEKFINHLGNDEEPAKYE